MLLEANISETAGDTGFVPKDRRQVGNGLCRVEWLGDRWRHVTQKGQGGDPIMFDAHYLENG